MASTPLSPPQNRWPASRCLATLPNELLQRVFLECRNHRLDKNYMKPAKWRRSIATPNPYGDVCVYTLSELSKTCSRFRAIAQPILHSYFFPTYSGMSNHGNIAQLFLFTRTCAHQRELRESVRFLRIGGQITLRGGDLGMPFGSIRYLSMAERYILEQVAKSLGFPGNTLPHSWYNGDDYMHDQSSLLADGTYYTWNDHAEWSMFVGALALALTIPNLETLDITGLPRPDFIIDNAIQTVLVGKVPPVLMKLRALRIRCMFSAMDMEQMLNNLLAWAPDLSRVELHRSFSFNGRTSTPAEFARARKVTHLELHEPNPTFTAASFRNVVRMFKGLETLVYRGNTNYSFVGQSGNPALFEPMPKDMADMLRPLAPTLKTFVYTTLPSNFAGVIGSLDKMVRLEELFISTNTLWGNHWAHPPPALTELSKFLPKSIRTFFVIETKINNPYIAVFEEFVTGLENKRFEHLNPDPPQHGISGIDGQQQNPDGQNPGGQNPAQPVVKPKYDYPDIKHLGIVLDKSIPPQVVDALCRGGQGLPPDHPTIAVNHKKYMDLNNLTARYGRLGIKFDVLR